jgi:arabinan endo-1,5-alpha-L-arabinosidase
VVGPPADSGEWTYLRIVVERLTGQESRAAGGDTESYTAYTSQDGQTWVRGGTWTHSLGSADIGLVAMGLTQEFAGDYTAEFDYVRVYRLQESAAR